MPHFIIECAESVINDDNQDSVLRDVHSVAVSSGLFSEGDIKVRVKRFQQFSVGGKSEPFIHVFSYIMQGRTTEQKALLSKALVQKLVELFPEVKNIAANIDEFERATYCNRNQL